MELAATARLKIISDTGQKPSLYARLYVIFAVTEIQPNGIPAKRLFHEITLQEAS